MPHLLRTAAFVSFLVAVTVGVARAQGPADLGGDSLRPDVGRAVKPPIHEGAVTAGLGFGSASRGLLVGAVAAYHIDGEFVALRGAIDPDRGRYAEYVDRARAVKPGTVFQRYEANLVLGAEWNVGPLLLGVDAGFGVVGFFNVQRRLLSRFDTVYFVSELPMLGIPVDLHARLPLGARLSLVGRLHAHVNFFEPTYGAAAELHCLLGRFPFDPSADGPVPDRPEASDSSGATPGLAGAHRLRRIELHDYHLQRALVQLRTNNQPPLFSARRGRDRLLFRRAARGNPHRLIGIVDAELSDESGRRSRDGARCLRRAGGRVEVEAERMVDPHRRAAGLRRAGGRARLSLSTIDRRRLLSDRRLMGALLRCRRAHRGGAGVLTGKRCRSSVLHAVP